MAPGVVIFYISSFCFILFLLFIGKQIFNFLLRGFAPFIPSRPWAVDQVMDEIKKMPLKKGFNTVSIGSGRSGLSHAIEREYPDARIVGVEDTLLSTFISWLQVFLQGSNIIVKYHKNLHNINISDKDLVYLKLDVDKLREMDKKLKFECRTGTIIISNGFLVPNFVPKKIVKLDDRKGRLSFFGRNRSLWTSKKKVHKKENKVYIYEVE